MYSFPLMFIDCIAGGVGMERWNGKVALVTGASAGMGAAVAERLVCHGLKVYGCARNVDRIQVSFSIAYNMS